MKPKVHLQSQKQEKRIGVVGAVSPAIHQENKSLAGERAKRTSQPTRAKARRVPEELHLLVFSFLVQAACLRIHR